jgi:hypothetical protein
LLQQRLNVQHVLLLLRPLLLLARRQLALLYASWCGLTCASEGKQPARGLTSLSA